MCFKVIDNVNNTIEETQHTRLMKLRGLLPDAQYRIEGIKEACSEKYLMETGIDLSLRGAYKCRIFTVSAVE